MIKNWLIPTARTASLLLGVVVLFGGCESKGPAEKAGESLKQSVQDAKDAVNPPTAGEKAGRAIDKAGDKIEQGIQDAKDAVDPPGPGEKAGRAVDEITKP